MDMGIVHVRTRSSAEVLPDETAYHFLGHTGNMSYVRMGEVIGKFISFSLRRHKIFPEENIAPIAK